MVLSAMMGPAFWSWQVPEVLWWEPLANAAIGMVFAPLMIWTVGFLGTKLLRKDAMGFGDVELFAMIGATVGAANSVLVLVFASVLGAIFGTWRMVVAKVIAKESPLRLGEWHEQVKTASGPSLAPVEGEALKRAQGFAESMEMEFVDLSEVSPEPGALGALDSATALDLQVLPLAKTDGKLKVALADPLDTGLVTRLREAAGGDLEFAIADPEQLRGAIDGAYGQSDSGGELWRRYYDVAVDQPKPEVTGHLPFIPPIALACLGMVVFKGGVMEIYEYFFKPMMAW